MVKARKAQPPPRIERPTVADTDRKETRIERPTVANTDRKETRSGRPTVADADRQETRIGRPTVADADRRETLVRVLTTETEHGELQQAATIASMSLSTWIRSVALERARALTTEKTRQDHDKK